MKKEKLEKLSKEELLQEVYRLNGELENLIKITELSGNMLRKEKSQLKANLEKQKIFGTTLIEAKRTAVIKALKNEQKALKNTKIMLFKEETIIAKQTLIGEYIEKLNEQDTHKTVETLLSLEEELNANDQGNGKSKLEVLCGTTSNIKRSSNTNKALGSVLQEALEICRIYQEATTTTEARPSIGHE